MAATLLLRENAILGVILIPVMYNRKTIPPVEVINEWLHYDPDTGILTWKKSPNRRIKLGSEAGSTNGRGYLEVKVAGERCLAHRVIWKMAYGNDPDEGKVIDHINRVKVDNRICNLRLATLSENNLNRDYKPGITGIPNIIWANHDKYYIVKVKSKQIKKCKTLEEAIETLQRYNDDVEGHGRL